MADVSLPTPAQLRAARELLGLSRAAASKQFGRGHGIIGEVERGRGGESTVARLSAFYEAAGVGFLPDGQVRMKALKGSR